MPVQYFESTVSPFEIDLVLFYAISPLNMQNRSSGLQAHVQLVSRFLYKKRFLGYKVCEYKMAEKARTIEI